MPNNLTQALKRMKKPHKRCLAGLLSLLLVLSVAAVALPGTFAASNFTISIAWNGSDPAISGSSFTYDSTKAEEKLVRLKISYKNTAIAKEYPPGSLIITVPGLSGILRSGSGGATSIAADPASASYSSYDWNYTYNAGSDTYTFMNNFAVATGATFAGSFEMIWNIPSRSSVHGFTKHIQASFRTTRDFGSIQSNTLQYSQSRTKDQFTLLLTSEPLYSAEGYTAAGSTTDYTWFRYEATGAQHWYARGISSSAQQMNLVVPAGALVFGSGFVYAHPGSGADAGKDVWVRAESSLWLQQVAGGIYRREKFVIAYPKATYPEKTPLPVRIDALGIFYEEENQSLLCSASISNLAEDYDYTDIPGPIYDILKYSTGMHSAFVDAHDSESRRFGAINSTHMENSAREYSSTFPLTLNYFPAASPVSHYDYFDLEFVDDIMDVETTGGSLRRLRDDEYTFTRVTIPASSNLVNYNGFPLQPEVYEVELSVRYRGVTKPAGQGEDAYVKLTQSQYTGKKIGASPLEFVLPADVVGVRVLIKGLRESIKGNGYYVDYGNIVTVHYIFHTSSSDIRLNTGRVINNMYFKLYAPDSTGTRQWINPFTAAEYERSSEAQRDIDLYGAYLDREAAKLLILEIPNEVAVTNTIQKTDESRETFFFSGSITGRFSFQEGNETKLDHFSMYTLVPQGLYLSKTARDPEAFKRQISFNGTDGNGAALSDALLRSHCSIELIPDYQSSGQYYIALHFTDLDTNPATITVSGIPMFKPKETVGDVNFTVRMEAMLLIDQPGLWYANSTDGRGAPWTDIDRDSNSTEIAALSSSSLTFYNPENTNLQANKLVETILTDSYVLPWKDNELGHYEDSVPGSYLGEEYRYKLRIHLGESKASGFLFVDALETGPLKEWQGSFLGVDYSEAQALLGKTPQVYYSAAVETVYQTGTAFEPTVPGGNWVLASSWAQPLSAVKSVAVKFPEDAIAQPGAYVSVVIRMRAPADEATRTIVAEAADDNEDYLTENNYAIHYSELTMDDVYIGREHLPSNDVPVRLLPYVGVINLQKLDAEDGSPLAGAVFDVYRRLGASPNPATDRKVRSDQMTGSNGKLRITDLPYGDYYLIETAAPLGYKTPSSGDADYILAVELMDDDPGYEISLTVENRRKEGQVSLRKRSDLNNSYPVAGAEFALYRENGTPYPYPDAIVTDNYGELTLTGLPWGNYYLVETAAPYGFDLPAAADNKYPFTVAASTDAGHMVLLDIKNPQEPAEVWLLKLERLENNDPTTTPVDAAVYRLYEDNGDENFTNDTRVGAYATDENGKIYVGGLGYGSYYFKEYTAAEGYYINPDPIRFTLLPQDGTAGNNVIGLNESEANKTLTTYNRRLYGSIYLQKTDEAGVLMNGVEYGLYRAADDSLVEARKTGEELITEGPNAGQPAGEAWLQWNNVPWGEYYVKEISAPRGYEVNDSEIPVTVERWTVSKLYIVDAVDMREKGSVELLKVSEQDENTLLPGAVFTLYRNDGAIYADDLTTDSNGKILVENLPWGSYYFLEKEAPAGYGLNPDKIRFSVNYLTSGIRQALTVTDPMPAYDLTITKRIKKADIVFAHGDPVFTFRITSPAGSNATGKALEYYRSVAFGEDYAASAAVDGNGYLRQSVLLAGLPAGTYTVSEMQTNRYLPAEVTLGSGTSGSVNTGAKTASVVLSTTYPTGEVIFRNEVTDQEYTSETGVAVNVVKKMRVLTGIVAIWNGPTGLTGEYLDRDLLEVTAVYDDGSSRVLGDAEYDLMLGNELAEPFEGMTGDYTVDAVYTENGLTRRGGFVLNLNIPSMYTWEVLSTAPVVQDGVTYDGTATITGYFGNAPLVRFPSVVRGVWSGVHYAITWLSPGNYSTKDAGTWEQDGKTYLVTQLGQNGCNLPQTARSIIIPDTVTTIDDDAFNGASYLGGDLVIPESVTYIGENAFYDIARQAFVTNLNVTINHSGPTTLNVMSSAFYTIGHQTTLPSFKADIRGNVTLGTISFDRFGYYTSRTDIKIGSGVRVGGGTSSNGAFLNAGRYADELNITITGGYSGELATPSYRWTTLANYSFLYAGQNANAVNLEISGLHSTEEHGLATFQNVGLSSQSVHLTLTDMQTFCTFQTATLFGYFANYAQEVTIQIRNSSIGSYTFFDAGRYADKLTFSAVGTAAEPVTFAPYAAMTLAAGDSTTRPTSATLNLSGKVTVQTYTTGSGAFIYFGAYAKTVKVNLSDGVTLTGSSNGSSDGAFSQTGLYADSVEITLSEGVTLNDFAFVLAGKSASTVKVTATGTAAKRTTLGLCSFFEMGDGTTAIHPNITVQLQGAVTASTQAFYESGFYASAYHVSVTGTAANQAILGVEAFCKMGYGTSTFHPNVTIDLQGAVSAQNFAFFDSGTYAGFYHVTVTGTAANQAILGSNAFGNIGSEATTVTIDLQGAVSVGANACSGAGNAANTVNLTLNGVGKDTAFLTGNTAFDALGYQAQGLVTVNIIGSNLTNTPNGLDGRSAFQNAAGIASGSMKINISGTDAAPTRIGHSAFREAALSAGGDVDVTLSGKTTVLNGTYGAFYRLAENAKSLDIVVEPGVTIENGQAFYQAGKTVQTNGSITISGTDAAPTVIGRKAFIYTLSNYGEPTTIQNFTLNISGTVSVGSAAFRHAGYAPQAVTINLNGKVTLEAAIEYWGGAFCDVGHDSPGIVTVNISGAVYIPDAARMADDWETAPHTSSGAFWHVGSAADGGARLNFIGDCTGLYIGSYAFCRTGFTGTTTVPNTIAVGGIGANAFMFTPASGWTLRLPNGRGLSGNYGATNVQYY